MRTPDDRRSHVDAEHYYDIATDRPAADRHLAGCPACRARLEAVHERLRDLTCREFVELVTDYLEGAIDEPMVARIDDHLRVCEGCRNYLDEMRATLEILGRIPADGPPAGLSRDVLLALYRETMTLGRRDG